MSTAFKAATLPHKPISAFYRSVIKFSRQMAIISSVGMIYMPRPLTPEEQTERERIAQIFAGGKPASEMVIEDQGPYQ